MGIKYNGLATMNGIVFECDGIFVKAIQRKNGIQLKGRTLPSFFGIWPKIKKIPVLRTAAFMVDAFLFRPLYLFDGAYLLMLAFILAIPYALEFLVDSALKTGILSSAALPVFDNLTGLLIFILVILFFRMTGIANYHAAEHKTGNYYDAVTDSSMSADVDFSIGDVNKYSRIHPRCGTNLLLPTMLIMLIAGYFITSFWQTLVVLAFTIELISIAARHRDKKWAKYLLMPGLYLQRLTTRECTIEQLQVGTAAFAALLEMKEKGLNRLDRRLEEKSHVGQ